MSSLQESRLAIGQFSCKVGDSLANLEQIAQLTRKATARDADLLVLPELSLTGYTVGAQYSDVALRLDQESAPLRGIQQLSHDVGLAVGFVEETADSLFYNSVGLWYRGQLIGLHRKVYPPTYGAFDEGKWFARGRDVQAFDTPWGRMAMLVCADAWHPALPYLAAHDGADLLLLMAASPKQGLSDDIDTLAGWHRLNRTHAMTLSAYVAFTNHCGAENDVQFTGGSQIVSPTGDVLSQTGDDLAVEVATVSPTLLRQQRLTMPFRRDDDLGLTAKLAQAIAARTESRKETALDRAISSASTPTDTHQSATGNGGVLAKIGPGSDEPNAKRI